MNIASKIVLKGQYILAQGNALGLRANKKIVREITLINNKILIRTKKMFPIFQKKLFRSSVQKEILSLFINLSWTVFVLFTSPRALPWAELYEPFRPKNGYYQNSFGL